MGARLVNCARSHRRKPMAEKKWCLPCLVDEAGHCGYVWP